MITPTRLRWIAPLLVAFAPLAASAGANDTAPAPPDTPRTITLDQSIVHSVGGDCSYRATLRGTARVVTAAGATRDDARQYTPRVEIHAAVTCAGGSARYQTDYSLTSTAQYSREELERTLARHAAVHVTDEDRVCTYTPRIAFDGDRVSASSVTQSCSPARGGGPLASPPAAAPLPLPIGGIYEREPGFPGPLGLGSDRGAPVQSNADSRAMPTDSPPRSDPHPTAPVTAPARDIDSSRTSPPFEHDRNLNLP